MQHLAFLAAVAGALLLAPSGLALVDDADGDGFDAALERVLGTNPYDPDDDPTDVGLNAIANPGFELQARAVAEGVTCPVFGDLSQNVAGVIIVTPCYSSTLRATGWSNGRSKASDAASEPRDADGDGDLEMVVPAQTALSHNFWHSFANAQQAFSANFDAFTFDVEVDGITPDALPNNLYLALSVSLTPFNDLHQFAVLYVECALDIGKRDLLTQATFTSIPGPSGATYLRVSLDPVDMRFRPYTSGGFEGCNNEAEAWASMDEDQRRAFLGTVRLVQTSFWQFNGAVIDNVDLRGSKPAAGVPDELFPEPPK